MGYAAYTLPDGREAGYGVEATCDTTDCATEIDRGLGYLCGRAPDGHRDFEEPGCGKYFCGAHLHKHDCPNPECGHYSVGEELYCGLARDHELPHRDAHSNKAFAEVEDYEDNAALASLPTERKDS